jgi:hypothetical protein
MDISMKSPTTKTAPRKRVAVAKKIAAKKPAAVKVVASAVAKPSAERKSTALPVKDVRDSRAKIKLVRDSFTLPEPDHELIKKCKKAAMTAGRETKKSEVVRAAIQAFSQLSLGDQMAAYNALQPIAVGRPKSK